MIGIKTFSPRSVSELLAILHITAAGVDPLSPSKQLKANPDLGTFMETLATIVLLTPILLPVVVALGVDPIHFGILLVITSEIGFLTPPLGVNLFVAMGIANVSLEAITKAVIPYLWMLFFMTLVLTALPSISLWLPRLLR